MAAVDATGRRLSGSPEKEGKGRKSPVKGEKVQFYDEKAETLTGAELEALQLERLKGSLKRIWESKAPYRAKMEEAGLYPESLKSLGDLERLPFTTKEDFRRNFPLGTLAVPLDEVVRVHASSGRIGTRTVVGYTRNYIEVWSELIARIAFEAGVRKTDVAQVSFTYGLFTGGFGLHYGLERLGMTVIPVSGGNTELQLAAVRELDPRFWSQRPPTHSTSRRSGGNEESTWVQDLSGSGFSAPNPGAMARVKKSRGSSGYSRLTTTGYPRS